VHGSPSSQTGPLRLAFSQSPLTGLHEVLVQSESPLVEQVTIDVGATTHSPVSQTSTPLQGLPSSSGMQSMPSKQSQAPGTLTLTQAPPEHWSSVQALPSVQGAVFAVNVHPRCVSHASSVQALSSSHTSALPPEHSPARQMVPTRQASPESQGLPLGTAVRVHLPRVVSQARV
jgi:hypothetical protein